jgi:hypothetical protein
MSKLINEIRHEQMLLAERMVIRNLERQGLSKSASHLSAIPDLSNPTLQLCDLVKPYLLDGTRLFTSKSIVVAVNDSQPLADRLADIELTIRLLTVLAAKQKEKAL